MALVSMLSSKKYSRYKWQGLHTFLFVWLLTITREVVFKAKDDCQATSLDTVT